MTNSHKKNSSLHKHIIPTRAREKYERNKTLIALPCAKMMSSSALSSFSRCSSDVHVVSSLLSSLRLGKSAPRIGGESIMMSTRRRQQRRQRGREAKREEEERATTNTTRRSRREVLKILPHTSGVALVVATTTMAIGGFTAQPSFAAGEKLSSIEEKELAKERRKAAVRAAAERAKETGVGGGM